jgi:hypothetical protein
MPEQERKQRIQNPRVRGDVRQILEEWATDNRHRTRVPASYRDGGAWLEPDGPSIWEVEPLSPKALRALIACKGWTIVDLATILGMRPDTFSRYIANSYRPQYIEVLVWGMPPYEESSFDTWRRQMLGVALGEHRKREARDRLRPTPTRSSFARYGPRTSRRAT